MCHNWALTTVISTRPNDPYTERIRPLTEPLFRDYCHRWGMDFHPAYVSPADSAWMDGTIAGDLGTAVVYASWPHRRKLLNIYDGVLYLDLDAVILDPERDIRQTVLGDRPIAMQDGLTGALMVLRSCRFTRDLLDWVWGIRWAYRERQWAEEGAVKEYFGWDGDYSHGEPAAFLGPTEHTDKLHVLYDGLKHPLDPNAPEHAFLMNPGGVHPIERRIELIRLAIEEREDAIRHV